MRAIPLLIAASVAVACASPASTREAPDAPAPVAAAPAPPVLPEPSTPPPSLVVFIMVDQLRADYFERFGPQLSGGLARLWNGGAVFTDAHQDHAITETAPGHASALSGRFPRRTGIVMNAAGVGDPQHPLIDSHGPGASPFRFRGTVLMDWMRVADPRARGLSVSRKDRGAILPMGRADQEVLWYDATGIFTTSTWYADTLAGWVQAFNARQLPRSYGGREWTLLLPASEYPEPDTVMAESGGRGGVFPHRVPGGDSASYALPAFPYIDEVTLAATLEGIQAMRLGTGPQSDLVAVSLSATDAVGHQYGPDSREVHDMVLRLDRMLGTFIDSVYRLRDSSRVVFAFTADHGVAPYPAVYAATRSGADGEAARYVVSLAPIVDTLRAALRVAGADTTAVRLAGDLLLVNRRALAARGLDADSLVDEFVRRAQLVRGVMRVDRVRDLATADTVYDDIARRWYHMLPPDLPVEAVVTLMPYHVSSDAYAQHGSPHDYDTHVPLIFYGPPFRPGKYDEFARVVDIGPTLAWLVRATPLEPLDGHVLVRALR